MRIIAALILVGILTSPSLAGRVDPSNPAVVATSYSYYNYLTLLLADGSVWETDRARPEVGYYRLDEYFDPPFPIARLVYWEPNSLVTDDYHVWVVEGTDWVDLGPVPISPISTDQQDMGSMKSRYRAPQQKVDGQK